MKNKLIVTLLFVCMLILAACGNTSNQASSNDNKSKGEDTKKVAFPEKSITLVVPYAAGGGTDATARALAKVVEKKLGVSIGVVNKTGGNATVGFNEVAKSNPDGYTLLMNTNEIALLPHMGLTPLTYEDFSQIAQINFDPSALTVPANAPYDTIEEFIDYAKKNPEKIRVGGTGFGGIWHLGAASIEKAAGVKFSFVPFDGAASAKTALLGGHIEAITVSPAEVFAQVEAGELKTLGVLSAEKSPVMPDVPTFKEVGYDIAVGVWRSIDAAANTPPEVVKILEEAFLEAAKEQEFTDFMEKNGMGIVLKGSSDYRSMVEEDHVYFKELLGELGLTK